jgi:nicotinate-nucleotide adenylyltransferase
MLHAAVDTEPGMMVDNLEISRGGVSYTIDTLRTLRGRCGTRPLCLIMGMDAFRSLGSWREWTSLTDYVHIIAVQRPGNDETISDPDILDFYQRRAAQDAGALRTQPSGEILIAPLPMLDISATRVRACLAEGAEVSLLLPAAVGRYIEREGLYRRAA